MSSQQATEAEKNLEIWKVKKLIKRLEAARGNGTSMISLIIRELLKPDQLDTLGRKADNPSSAKRSDFPPGSNAG